MDQPKVISECTVSITYYLTSNSKSNVLTSNDLGFFSITWAELPCKNI